MTSGPVPPCLTSDLSVIYHHACQAGCPPASGNFPAPPSHLAFEAVGYSCVVWAWLYVGFNDLYLGLYTCTSPTETSSPAPCNALSTGSAPTGTTTTADAIPILTQDMKAKLSVCSQPGIVLPRPPQRGGLLLDAHLTHSTTQDIPSEIPRDQALGSSS